MVTTEFAGIVNVPDHAAWPLYWDISAWNTPFKYIDALAGAPDQVPDKVVRLNVT
jgi:hypothetical protein